ncbi:hypothetical protein CEXT_619171 [Caerostris extrusa]|uniref:Uncharacterized protein n=1 Tax=Caerostris extrusa TaxID=172846 RepID=A0AAV4Y218_CAEEX|nr:hypothetical protein CEXT_619171 [Caerostris extrusa]
MLSVEAALYVNAISRKAKCSILGTNTSLAIVDLRWTDVDCEVVVSRASSVFRPLADILNQLLVCVLVFRLVCSNFLHSTMKIE